MVDQRFASGTFGFTEQFFVGLLQVSFVGLLQVSFVGLLQVSFSGFRVVLDREVTWLIGVLANRCPG